MPELRKSATVPASGTVVISFQHYKTGLQWIISQLSNSTNPFRVGSVLTVDRNGGFITNTPLASGDSAAGPPYLLLNASDSLNFTFTGMTAGDVCIASIFYTEGEWSDNPMGGLVV
jgi:hypothetical protein